MHRYRILMTGLVILLGTAIAFAQNVYKPNKSKIFDSSSPHGAIGAMGDGNGCTICHAPHNGSSLTLQNGDQGTGKVLLWAQAFTTQTFGTYNSQTMTSTPVEIGGSAPDKMEVRVYSFLCMSCHDGVTTTSLIQATNMHAVGNGTNSFGLQNDHPVNMNYDPSKNAGLAPVSAVQAAGLFLFGSGATNTVQCASCHDPHDHTNDDYLRVDNSTQSKLCTTCHL